VKASDHLALLKERGLSPKKSFGQNFLVSDQVVTVIAARAVPDAEVGTARVIELGAGPGALSAALCERSGHLVAVERDRDLLPVLEAALSPFVANGTLTLLEADAQTLDLPSIIAAMPLTIGPRILTGNLPYQLTGQLLRLAVQHAASLDRIVFMVQAEVADRLVAPPGGKTYGALTVFVQAACEVTVAMTVPSGAFVPPPAVTSKVVVLSPRRPPLAVETDEFRAVVKAAFATRRKTLRNAWRGLARDLAHLEEAAREAGVSLDARGETLDVAAFDRFARALASTGSDARPGR
jgi:16S rRNA (adenine1518-N6/adenine1519-N6)-dimethyltransferase